MKRLIQACLILLMSATVSTAGPPPGSQLELRAYDPAVDPDIDMFISHWEESVPVHIFGNMIERAIFTPIEGEAVKPEKRDAVLEHAGRLSYGKLQKHKSTVPAVLEGEQIIFSIEGGPAG